MNEKKKKPKVLTLDETVELLGAERPQNIGPIQMNPLGMQVLAARVAQRLAGKRGRPTDKTWDISRKIPMKTATWESFQCIAKEARPEARPAAGQIAAIALEKGLRQIREENKASANKPIAARSKRTTLDIDEQSQEEAKVLCPVIAEGSLW